MKTLILLLVATIFIITDQTNALPSKPRQFMDADLDSDNDNLMDGQYPWMENYVVPMPLERRSESAERYFDWASKTQRPVEYFRGKRFWLFTKKDDQSPQQDAASVLHPPGSTMGQGIWRSGIVGRR